MTSTSTRPKCHVTLWGVFLVTCTVLYCCFMVFLSPSYRVSYIEDVPYNNANREQDWIGNHFNHDSTAANDPVYRTYTVSSLTKPVKKGPGRSLLLIGDSIDRYILSDWCERNNNYSIYRSNERTVGTVWMYPFHFFNGTANRAKEVLWFSPQRCKNIYTGDSISHIHIFGSKDHAPYLFYMNHSNESTVSSISRIYHALEVYSQQFGIPDRVIFHSTQWDKKYNYIINNNTAITALDTVLWTKSVTEYYVNVNKRLDQIISFFQRYKDNKYNIGSYHSVEVGLRTAVWNYDFGEIGYLHELNKVTRQIAIERNLLLYDYDRDLWSNKNQSNFDDYELIHRDNIHPTYRHSIDAGDKLLDRRYSRYMICNYTKSAHRHSKEVDPSHTIYSYDCSNQITADEYSMERLYDVVQSKEVYLIRTEKRLYFTRQSFEIPYTHNNNNNNNLTNKILHIWDLPISNNTLIDIGIVLQLSEGDILNWCNDQALQDIATYKGPLYDAFLKKSKYVLTKVIYDSDDVSHIWQLRNTNPTNRKFQYVTFIDHFYYNLGEYDWKKLSLVTNKTSIINNPIDSFWIHPNEPFFTYGGEITYEEVLSLSK